MEIKISPYELIANTSLNAKSESDARKGILLRYEHESEVGYSCLNTWPELGDPELDEILARYKKDGFQHSLLKTALFFAKRDAKARAQGLNLLKGIDLPASHFPLGSRRNKLPKIAQEFHVWKIKVGKDPEQEAQELLKLHEETNKNIEWRLDANESWTQKEWETFIMQFVDAKHRIQFIEDPFTFSHKKWRESQEQTKVAFALDRQLHLEDAELEHVMVLKPAIHHYESFLIPFCRKSKSFFITDYMGHPLGQVQAAWVAGNLKKDFRNKILSCGYLSHFLFEPNLYSDMLRVEKEKLIPRKNQFGFGFDEILEKENWIAIP